MPTPYQVEVVTPDGPLFTGEAETVVVPGEAGELGVLANHAPLVSGLRAGETRVTVSEGQVRRWATADGFVQVRRNRAVVLVGEAVAAEDIDRAAAEERLRDAQALLERAESGAGDPFRARREVRFAEALVRVAAG